MTNINFDNQQMVTVKLHEKHWKVVDELLTIHSNVMNNDWRNWSKGVLRIIRVANNNSATLNPNDLIPVRINKSGWLAIIEIIESECATRGEKWRAWAGILRIKVLVAIDEATGNSSHISQYFTWVDWPKKNWSIAHEIALFYTNCVWLASALHLGGHPLLPFKQRIVIGLKSCCIEFYDYQLRLLHSVPIMGVVVKSETRHIHGSSYGTAFMPKGSGMSFGSSNQRIDIHPDTLILRIQVNGIDCDVEFDMRSSVDPLDFIQTFNELRVGLV